MKSAVFATLLLISAAGTTWASEFTVGHNGAWFNPQTDGQGVLLEVSPEVELVSVYWFTFDPVSGDRTWFVGVGAPEGSQVRVDLLAVNGGQFDAAGSVERDIWGFAQLSVDGCDTLRLSYDGIDVDVPGEMTLQRAGPDSLCGQLEEGQLAVPFVTATGAALDVAGSKWGYYDSCVAVSDTESWRDETFSFSDSMLTIMFTRFGTNRCGGLGELIELNFELVPMGRTTAWRAGEAVVANRVLVVDPATGQSLKQTFYFDEGGMTHARFADEGGAVDERGYPTELFDLLLERN